jgi:hypothetical protein
MWVISFLIEFEKDILTVICEDHPLQRDRHFFLLCLLWFEYGGLIGGCISTGSSCLGFLEVP